MNTSGNKIAIYTLAGMATSLHFMEEFRLELEHQFLNLGWEVRSKSLFPYGDWNRRLISQVHEIRHDLFPLGSRKDLWIAGRRAADVIINSYTGGYLLIIGHSGGGIAGVHAARMLLSEKHISKQQIPALCIVQVGSPRCAVPPDLKASVMYVRSVNLMGKVSDPVTRIGSWGGWVKGRFNLPVRKTKLYSPGSIVDLPMIGGHQDYFRNTASFCNKEGKSNLNLLNQALWSWLQDSRGMDL